MNKWVFTSLGNLFTLIRYGLFALIFLLFISFLTTFIDSPRQYTVLMQVNHFTNTLTEPVTKIVKLTIPYRVNNINFSALILAVLLLFSARISGVLADWNYSRARRIAAKYTYEKWRLKATETLPVKELEELDKKFKSLDSSNSKNRKQMLKEFALLKSKLDVMGQHYAFLAIDVVDSTGMKRDEDKYLSSYDFDRYNELVNEALNQAGVVKYTMTPDGIMSAFRTTDDAVKAALYLLEKLKLFNQHEKKSSVIL